MRRTAVRPWKPISIGVISAIALSGLVATPALAAEGDPTQAQGEFLSADLLDGDLAGAALSYASIPGGPALDSDPLTVSALGGSIELVSGGLQLPLITDGTTPGLLDLGQAGALSSYAATPSTDSAIAASGLLGADGAIAFDEDEEPATASTSSLDVTALLDQLGVEGLTDEIVDELSLEIGALASRATSDGTDITDEYRVADLSLNLHSQLVGDLTTDIRSAVDALETPLQATLEESLGAGGAIEDLLDLIDIDIAGLTSVSLGDPVVDVTVADLSTAVDTALGGPGAIVVSDDESVTIDLTSGDITVDFAQLLNPDGVGLNDFDPNTDLLTEDTILALTQGVANALGKIVGPVTTAVNGLVDDTTVVVSIPIVAQAALIPGVTAPINVITGAITIDGSLGEIVSGVDVIDITASILPGLPIAGTILNPLLNSLLATVTDDVLPGLLSGVADSIVDPLLDATAASITAAVQDVVEGATTLLNPVLDDVLSEVATITINAQPTLLGQPADIDEVGAFTVRALSITLLPNVTDSSFATIDLASSTVLAQVDVPTIITDPEGPVNPGDSITVSGSGFTCGPITVTISDGETVLDTFTPERSAEGTFSFEYTVPEDIDPTTLTIVATTPAGCDEGDDTTIVVVDPPTVVATPNPVEEGESLTIAGSDFTCGPVTVTITGVGGTVLATIADLPVTDEGTFSTSYLVPAGTDPQTLTVTAVATGDCDDEASTTVVVDDAAVVTVEPEGPFTEGDVLTISGTGFDCGPVTVTVLDGETQLFVLGPFDVTDGAWSTTVTVPAGIDPGTLTLVASTVATAPCDDEDEVDIEIVDPPVVVAEPDPADPGQTITISGSGFQCGPVDVTITGGTEPVVITGVPVSAAGTWSTSYLVPVDTDANTLTITAVATGDCDDEGGTEVDIDQPESLELTPAQVRIGDAIDIDGDGWATGSPVTVTFSNAAGQVGQPVVITPGTGGTIDGTFTVPAGTAAGTLTGTATQDDDTSTDTVVVFVEPTVVVDPDPVDPGETITISGSGFLCGPVDVTISDGDTELLVIEDVPVSAAGTWSTTYVVPADIDATTLTITAVATGTCGDEGGTDVEIDQPETVELTPAQVRIGDAIDIDGDGWATGSPVTVTFSNAAGQVGQPVVITPGTGGTIDGTFTVPAGTAAGTLTGTATQDDDTSTDTVVVFVEPTVVVDPDPVDPGETITISGSGFLCGPVDVTISDGDTELLVIEDVPVAADGTWSTTFVVPADIDATSLTITAVATGTCGDEDDTDVEIDQPETVTFTPDEVRGGDEVDIEGEGWDADGGPVTVVFEDAAGNQVGQPVVITPGAGGTIDGTFTVPAGTAAGELTGTATQGDDETTDVVEVFGPATVSVEPGTVRAGADVTVGGGGWLPNGGTVTVTFEDADGTVVGEPVVLTPSADGTIDGDFTVPEGTDAGILTATAVQGDDEAADTLVVAEEPSVTVEPDTARPGDTVTVGGDGWLDGTPVTVVFTDEDGNEVGDELSLTPTGGVISGSFVVPADVDPGTLTATATQGEDVATDELEVSLAPTVSATPEQLHVGDAITIGGTGWDPASVVTVTVTNADDETVGTPLALTPNSDGVISGSFTVPEGTDLGDLTVTATQGEDAATDTVEVVADPTVEVEPNPADPGQQVTISGDGFLCGPVTVTISAGETVLTTITGVPVVDGQWTTVYTVPVDVTVDSLTISAVATGDCGDAGETDLDVDLVETLTATPAFAEIGDVVTVAGTGWEDGAVSITATDLSGDVVGTLTATSVEGSFSVPFTVPAGTDLGALEFEATQGEDVETATVSVVAIPAGPASIVVSPSTVEPGDVVAIDGEGFDPTAGVVTITFTTGSGAIVGSTTATVQPDGALFTAAFTVPGDIAPQQLTATAVQGPRTATDRFDVRAANLPVIRLAGPERFTTAVEISRDAFPFGADIVYLANGAKFPDALSAAPAAAQSDSPLLLTRLEYLETAVIEELDRLDPDLVVIVGDVNSVSANVAAQVAPYAGDIVRLGGDDRFETSQLIAEFAFDSADTAYVATGFNFPDALTAGAAAGADGAPLLLTYGPTPPAGVIDTMQDLGVDGVYIAGDGNSVPMSQEAAFESAGIEVLDRYAGTDRFDTGIQVSQASFDGPAERIYVATGLRFPDALAGSAIAGSQNVPVFVTRPNCMIPGILDEVDRLDSPQIVLLGDQLALDQNVFDLVECPA